MTDWKNKDSDRKEKFMAAVLHAMTAAEKEYPDREVTSVRVSPGDTYSVLCVVSNHKKGIMKVDYEVNLETGEIVGKEEILR